MPRYPIATALLFNVVLLTACQKPDETPAPATPAPVVDAVPAATPKPVAGSKATPALSLPAIDGKTFELAAHRGKWVVVNFWATWCAPCLKEMPELSALDAMREDVEVVGLAYEDIDAAAMREFLKVHPVVYPIAIVDTYSPPADFDTPRGLPMTYLIAPDGKVAKKILGPVTAGDIEAAIAAASGKQKGADAAAGMPKAASATGAGS